MRPILGDGIEGLNSLPAGSVALVLSDLPSGETAADFDRKPDLSALFSGIWRALKPDGVAVLMASSLRFASECMLSGGKTFRYDIIWEKGRPTGHLNAKKRPLRAHEFILVFARRTGCFVPQMTVGHAPLHQPRRAKAEGGENYGKYSEEYHRSARGGSTDRYPRSVLYFRCVASCYQIHPQQKPDALLRNLVRQYSNPGDLVADPFAGSGSALEAAIAEGRRAVGWDTSSRFAEPRAS